MSLPRRLPHLGEVVNQRYRVLAERGGGAMGVLFQAEDLERRHVVALKVLRPEILEVPEVVERLRREGLAISLIAHEHVVRIWDVGTTDQGLPFLSMEWLDGTDLGAILEEVGAIPIHTAVVWVRQACAALHEAHQRGIVHRDIKPANLFLAAGPRGERMLKVIDFGVSKLELGAAHLTQTHVTVGTPLYMSPEQVRASRDIDARSDVWALGVVLFELISGTPPFVGESALAVTASIVADPPQSLDALIAVPPGLSAVIMRALAKRPADRFPSVRAFSDALAPYEQPGIQPSSELEAQATLVTELPPDFDLDVPPASLPRQPIAPAHAARPAEPAQPVAMRLIAPQPLPLPLPRPHPLAQPIAPPQAQASPGTSTLSRSRIIASGVVLGLAVVAIGVVIALGVRARRELKPAPEAAPAGPPRGNNFARAMQARAEAPMGAFKPCVMHEGSMELPGLLASRVDFVDDLEAVLRDKPASVFRRPGTARDAAGDTSIPLTLVSPLAVDLRRDDLPLLIVTAERYFAATLGESGVEPLDASALERFVSVLTSGKSPLLFILEGNAPVERLRDALRLARELPNVGVAVVPRKDVLSVDRSFACVDEGDPARPATPQESAQLANGLRAAEDSCGRDHPFDVSTTMTLRLVPGSARGQACWQSFERTSARGRACAIVAGKRLSAGMPVTTKGHEVTVEFLFRGQPLRPFCDR